jgi:hypothetical protein
VEVLTRDPRWWRCSRDEEEGKEHSVVRLASLEKVAVTHVEGGPCHDPHWRGPLPTRSLDGGMSSARHAAVGCFARGSDGGVEGPEVEVLCA